MGLKKAAECIKRNKNFLITSHTNPEGDALGSELSFYFLLKALGKSARIVNDDAIPYGYELMPGAKNIIRYKKGLRGFDFGCFAILDCSDLKRCGNVYKLNRQENTILNIDHHISNSGFGHVNWIEPHASSSAEMVFWLYKYFKVAFKKETATLLYTGIMTDTGSFRYGNTSSETHKIAAELLKHGVDVTGVYRQLYENKPFGDLKQLAKILASVRRCSSGRIAWFELGCGSLKNKRFSFDLGEVIMGFARTIKNVEVAAVFKEACPGKKPHVRVNLRSQGRVDVNRIANFFGGGGHKAASGCTVDGTLAEVKKKVLSRIKENL